MTRRWRRCGATTIAVGLLAATGAALAPVPALANARAVHVIVEAQSSRVAGDLVTAAGGRVTASLSVVDGVAATADAAALHELATRPGVTVVRDTTLHPTDLSFGSTAHDVQLAALDPGSVWSTESGAGIAVGLIDTGVTATADLHSPRLVTGPDLSGDGDGVDHYGHGTFMAGLIGGDGNASGLGAVQHVGVAPGASVVSVKVAGADGSTTLSRVLAGIGWMIDNRYRLNIRVLNLSFGVTLSVPVQADPLDRAVEAAWNSGIAVVAAAGNGGAGDVDVPGADRSIITVGATDTMGTPAASDDAVASWSSHQQFAGYSKPEVVAPGVSVVSSRDPGSTIDVANPQARVGDAYFRGSGTSMSTALVSGAIATLLQRHPTASPDEVKAALIAGAVNVSGGRAVDVSTADAAFVAAPAPGGGSGSRGTPASTNATSSAPGWNATSWRGDGWNATSWRGGGWNATSWRGGGWNATSWRDDAWDSTSWRAEAWGATP